jgi:hypothetical protein
VSEADALDNAFTRTDVDKSKHLTTGELRKLMDGLGLETQVQDKVARARVLELDV